jgi:drug/metabolite transporter (DMT)-like permease
MTTTPHAAVRRAYIFGILSVVLWSTTAAAAASLAGKATFHDVVYLMQLFAFAALFATILLRKKQVEFLTELRVSIITPFASGNFRPAFLLLGFALSITLYHSFFFYALQTGPRLEANIINYLWPILLTVMSGLLRLDGRKLELKYVLLLCLSFLGAASIVLQFPSAHIPADAYRPLIFALLAALVAPIYMLLSRLLGTTYFSDVTYVYVAGFIISIGLQTFLYLSGAYQFQIAPNAFPYLAMAYMGIFTLAAAHICWTQALILAPTGQISNLAYLNPILSSIILVIVFHDQISTVWLLGATLILISNVLSNPLFSFYLAEGFAVATFFLVGIYLFFRDRFPLARDVYVEFLPHVLAILTGFMLARMWEKSRREETELARFFLAISDGVGKIRAEVTDSDTIKHLLAAVDRLVVAITDFDMVRHRPELLEKSLETRGILYETLDHIAKTGRDNNAKAATLNVSEAKASFLAWEVLRLERAQLSEILSAFALCFMTIIATLANTENSFLSDLFGIIFSTTVAYLVFKIYEYNRTPTMCDVGKIALFQKILTELNLELYVPDENVLRSSHLPASLGSQIRVRRNGLIAHVDIAAGQWAPREFHLARLTLGILILASAGCVLALLAIKHGAF